MARTKTVSQNIALFSSQGADSTGSFAGVLNSFPFLNVTSLDFDWSQNKSDVVTYSKLASRDRIAIESPVANLGFSYYLGAGLNEQFLGLYMQGDQSTLKWILERNENRNYFIFVSPEGSDAEGLSGATSGCGVVGIGNGFLNSYSIEGTIGDFPTVSVSVAGLNIKGYTGGDNQDIPGVNPINGNEITGNTFTIPTVLGISDVEGYYTSLTGLPFSLYPAVIKPGDVFVDISTAGGLFYNYSSTDVQSFRVGFDLNRQPLNKLGSRFSLSQEIQYPINVNFEVTMIAKDIGTGSLSNFLCNTGLYHAKVGMNYTSCGTGTATEVFGFTLRNISLEGQSWSTQAGSDPQTVTTTWIGQIGGTGDLLNGLFMSGYLPLND